ncbi:putative adenosylhomocysteinase [Iris pallida]|uniref:Adenosylhomocysteinase n=1 Tax=Iris pallida TaxID=29817 RepID=A0AAX6GQS5_IRIPA|nr:putative adenosylhomocysteinase [Iris pallida]
MDLLMDLLVEKTSTGREYKVKDIVPGGLRPPRDRAGRGRDARAHVLPHRVRPFPALLGRPHHRLPPHDHPDRRPHRDPHRPRRRGPLVLLQHLLHPGPRRRRHRPRLRRRLRLEGRDPPGVLVVHRARPRLGPRRRPRPHRRRRGRLHPADPRGGQGRGGVREERDRAGPGLHGQRRVPDRAHHHQGRAGGGPHQVQEDEGEAGRRLRGDHHRGQEAVTDAGQRDPALPGDQRQRLGHQEQVRQLVWMSPLSPRRTDEGHRCHDCRQGRSRSWLW